MIDDWALRRCALLLLVTGTFACGDAATPPDAGGDYVATLSGAADGAAVVELTGAGIEAVTALDGQLFTEQSGSTVRVVIVRDAPGPIRFGVKLARGSSLPRATVLEVAAGDDALRASLAGYSVKFTR